METTKVISVNIVGKTTGRAYSGSFTVKMLMSTKDEMEADLRRRQIIGPSPEGVQPAANLQYKAFILGQIYARSIAVPKFWEDAEGGLELYDANVIMEIYDAILEAEEQFRESIMKDSEEALEKLKSNNKKKNKEE